AYHSPIPGTMFDAMAKLLNQLWRDQHPAALAGSGCSIRTVRAGLLDGRAELLQQLVPDGAGYPQERGNPAVRADAAARAVALPQSRTGTSGQPWGLDTSGDKA